MEVVKVLSYIREEERSAIAKGRTRSFCSSLAPLTFTGITFCSHTTLAGYPYSNHSSENCLQTASTTPRSHLALVFAFSFFLIALSISMTLQHLVLHSQSPTNTMNPLRGLRSFRGVFPQNPRSKIPLTLSSLFPPNSQAK